MVLTPVLSGEQTQSYCENNYLLVSGLIPEAIAEQAEAAMWRWMGLQPDDPEAWENVQFPESCDDPDVLAVYTPQFLSRCCPTWRGRYGSRSLSGAEAGKTSQYLPTNR